MMARKAKEAEPAAALKRAALLCPQPVAMACGRVLRARNPQEAVDACLRTGEVLARYLAAVALSSFAAREPGSALALTPLEGHLAFGHFLAVVQQVAKIGEAHPAAPYLAAGFKAKKDGVAGPTDEGLKSLLELRNELGHQLDTLNEARARTVLTHHEPQNLVVGALAGVEGLLRLPLFLIEDQQLVRKTIRARRLLLMGETADPPPEEIELAQPIEELRTPYIAVDGRVLRLPPMLVWDIVEMRANYRLLFLDKLSGKQPRYKTVDADEVTAASDNVAELAALCAGAARPAEEIRLSGGRHLAREWSDRRKLTEDAAQRGEGLVPWELLDRSSLAWFAARLEPESDKPPAEIVQERLLDGRTSVDGHERCQLVLLFGSGDAVREELRRDLIDLRVERDPERRWEERLLLERANLLDALRQSVDFLARHLGTSDLELDQLTRTTGSADYVAIREALVNQFVHQDYADRSTPAQVVIRPEETVLFNAGYSLVDTGQLVAGGKSQSRNPLVARALRLIGFAELAGSGIRMLENAWRRARRRPPRFDTDREANNFTVILDWRPLPELHDAYWQGRLGVKLTEPQAKVLAFLRDPGGATPDEIATATGLDGRDVPPILTFLERQVLVDRVADRYSVSQHLQEILG